MHIFDATTRTERGFALPLVAIIIAVIFAVATVSLDASLSGRRTGKLLQNDLSASQLAEAGAHHALACLNGADVSKCGGNAGQNYDGETDVSMGGGSFTTTVTGSGASRTITSVGSIRGASRTVAVDLTTVPPTDDTGFSYALQSGAGGAHLENNAQISGTIYSNGDVDCQSTVAIITGDAFSAKAGGVISDCTVQFHAHADSITGSVVEGDAYYQTSIAGTTVEGTSHSGQATPDLGLLPSIDLEFWRESAENGGTYNGDYWPADNAVLGPLKINGDLNLDQNVDITLAGPLWVVGNVTTYNNSSLTLDASFGDYSTAILADDESDPANNGKITIVNNTGISGSGSSKSHIMFVSTNTSTSDTEPALSVANNAVGAVFYALNGTMRLQSNASAKSLAGYRLFLDQNAVVTYVESDFTGEFSNSPGTSWRMIDGTWRETAS